METSKDNLVQIAELKKDWTLVQDDSNKFSLDYDFSDVVDGPTLLCGQVKPVEMSELLATLPPMSQVDELIEEFFDYHKSSNPTVRKLHQRLFSYFQSELTVQHQMSCISLLSCVRYM